MPDSTTDPHPPRCGECNYIVRGISSFTCPECGGDLREVGIDVGQRRRTGWWPAVSVAVVWGLLVAFGMQMIRIAAREGAPRQATFAFTATLATPSSKQYEVISVEGTDQRLAKSPAELNANDVVSSATVTLVGKTAIVGSLKVDVASNTFTEVDSSGNESPAQSYLGLQSVKEWLERSTGSTDPKIYDEAQAVANLLRSRVSQHSLLFGAGGWNVTSGSRDWQCSGQWSSIGGKPFGQTIGSFTISAPLPIWYTIVIALLGLVIWLLVARRIFRRLAPPRLRA